MSIRAGVFIISMDQDLLVYKIDNLVKSSLSSSFVLTQYKIPSPDQL